MTDSEIIKALEWCSELRLCVDCPMRAEGYFSHSGNACRSVLMNNALALINRLIKERDNEHERYVRICEELGKIIQNNTDVRSELLDQQIKKCPWCGQLMR